jgi:hypothetical protein
MTQSCIFRRISAPLAVENMHGSALYPSPHEISLQHNNWVARKRKWFCLRVLRLDQTDQIEGA